MSYEQVLCNYVHKEAGALHKPNHSEESGTPKGGSPLALAELVRYKSMLESIPKPTKQIIFEASVPSSRIIS